MTTVTKAILARVVAKPGMEAEVEQFLTGALALAQKEEKTITWYAVKMDERTFGIFDSFPDDDGRQAHLAGPIAAALMENADRLLAEPPSIEQIDILAAKLPS